MFLATDAATCGQPANAGDDNADVSCDLVIAINASSGGDLWSTVAEGRITGLDCNHPLTKSDNPDCVVTGKDAVCLAFCFDPLRTDDFVFFCIQMKNLFLVSKIQCRFKKA